MSSDNPSKLAGLLTVLVSVPSYILFLVSYMAIVSLAGGFGLDAYWAPYLPSMALDGNPLGDGAGAAWGFNALLTLLLLVQHTVMARASFKSASIMERAIYVLVSSVLILFMRENWQPLSGMLWDVENGILRGLMWAVFVFGFVLTPMSSMLHDHFQFFGLRQGVHALLGKAQYHIPFLTPWLYKQVRHPMMTGFLLGLWVHPTMTMTQFSLALLFTLYILFGVKHEESGLIAKFGDSYRQYMSEVPSLFPNPFRK